MARRTFFDVVVERQKTKAIALDAVALTGRPHEEHDGADDERQAAEKQDRDDVQATLRARANRTLVCSTKAIELSGINTAHNTGVMAAAKHSTSVVLL